MQFPFYNFLCFFSSARLHYSLVLNLRQLRKIAHVQERVYLKLHVLPCLVYILTECQTAYIRMSRHVICTCNMFAYGTAHASAKFSSASIFKVIQCCSKFVKMLYECQTARRLILIQVVCIWHLVIGGTMG